MERKQSIPTRTTTNRLPPVVDTTKEGGELPPIDPGLSGSGSSISAVVAKIGSGLLALPDDKKKQGRQASRGARVHHRYHDRTEDTVAVTHDDLREVRDLGTIHQILFGTGMFLFSGAFWESVRTISEQTTFAFTAWLGMYAVSMIAGLVLAGIGAYLFHSKQRRLDKYFPEVGEDEEE